MVVEDRRLALALGEQFEHAAHVGAGAAAGELAVAERAGAAFAEQVVALADRTARRRRTPARRGCAR